MTGATFAATWSRCVGAAVFTTLLSGTVLAPDSAARAADGATCLAAPKSATPPGEHWFYRVERGTKRRCWYTRAGSPRKAASKIAVAKQTTDAADTETPAPAQLAPAPLQMSVANARAEADLSSIARPDAAAGSADIAAPADPPPAPNWKLAERWSSHAAADQERPPPTRVAPATPAPAAAPQFDAEADTAPDGLIEIAAGTVALLGLATLLTTILIRRRGQNRPDTPWQIAPRGPQGTGIRPTLTDLNDDPAMAWRKRPKAVTAGFATLSPTAVGAPPRTPRGRPADRA